MKLTSYEFASKGKKEFGIYLAASAAKAALCGVGLFCVAHLFIYGAGMLYLMTL